MCKGTRWRPRFSLRTLVLGVVVYGGLWSATEVWGGRDFRERIEARTEELRLATVALRRRQAREARIWQDEAFYFPAGEHFPGIPTAPIPDAGTEHASSGAVGQTGPTPDGITAVCDVETLAVAPFLLRVQYTCLCVDANGKGLPLSLQDAPDPDGQGWVLWCFGCAWSTGD